MSRVERMVTELRNVRAERDGIMDLLRRYRKAHHSMAITAQEAGAAEVYRRLTLEVDALVYGEIGGDSHAR